MVTRDEISAVVDEMRSMLDAMNENQSWQVQQENDRLLELLYVAKPLKQHLVDPVLYIPGAGAVSDWYPGVLKLTRRMQAFLKANPDWRPPGDTAALRNVGTYAQLPRFRHTATAEQPRATPRPRTP